MNPADKENQSNDVETSAQLVSFNRYLALERVGGDEELLREVVQLFLTEYPELFGQLTQAVEHGEALLLERAAHTLKGSLSTIGGEIAANEAFLLEVMGRTKQLQGAGQQLSKLSQSLLVLREDLKSA